MKLAYSVRQMMAAVVITAGVAVAATQMPVRAESVQAPTLQAALAADAAQMGQKFAGLARVMDGKYDWRPGQGVRSVGDVLNLIVAENGMLTAALTGAAAAGRPAAITSAAQMQEALRTSSATLQKTITGLSDADLNASTSIFGQNTTKRGAIIMVLGDQHEHLGQSIAYARMNSIVPPWSK